MKKRVLSVFLILAMMFSLVACSPSWKSFTSENKRVAEWGGTTFTGKGNVKVEVKTPEKKSENLEIPYSINGKAKGNDLAEVNMEMSLKGIRDLAKVTGEKVPATFPEKINMHIFATKDKAYIEKKVFTDMLGQETPKKLKDIKEEYLALDVNSTQNMFGANAQNAEISKSMTKYLNSKEFEANILELVEKSFKGFKPSVDMKVSGNTYTYEAGIDQIINDLNSAVETGVKNFSEIEAPLMDILKKMDAPVKKEDLEKMVKSYNKAEFEKNTNDLKNLLKGSNVKLVTTFNKDSYDQNIVLNLNMQDMFKINLTMDLNSKRDDNVVINLPKSAKNLNMLEYMGLFMPENIDLNAPIIEVLANGEEVIFDQEPVIENGRTLVPVRALLEKLGAKVEWDAKTKKVIATKNGLNLTLTIGSNKAIVNGKEATLDVPAKIINGRTFIPLRFVSENLGYKVNFDNSASPLYVIDVYNISEAELQKAKEKELQKQSETLKEQANSAGIIGGKDEKTSIKVQ